MACQSQFWGKLQKNSETGQIQGTLSIIDHSADVGAICESLLSQKVIRHRLARLAGLQKLSRSQCARLCVFACLHDIGKFNWGFQNKKLPCPLFKSGHVREVLALFGSSGTDSDRLSQSLDIDIINNWGLSEDAACRLLIAAICHHGRPLQYGMHVSGLIWEARAEGDPFQGIAELVQLTKQWFPEAWEGDKPDLPLDTAFHHAFSGLVMLSDWLGSDTRFFPFESSPALNDTNPLDRMSFSRNQSHKAIESIGLFADGFRSSLSFCCDLFQKISDYPANPVQQGIKDIPIHPSGGITILEAPTGNGKTEAALVRFIQLLQSGAVDGMYFALPTRTAATQIHQRVVSALKKAFPDSSCRPPVTLAVPGYIQVDDQSGYRLPHFEVLWNDDDTSRWRFRGWASEHPKRYLAGAVVVGTIDQVLLSRLTVSHAHMRAFCLFRHLLVIDEVHASDAYMNAILEEVLRWHIRAGGHALLMSATLASTARQRLTFPDRVLHTPDLDQAIKTPYPLITQRSEQHQTEVVFHLPTTRQVQVEIHSPPDAGKWIAKSAISFATQGAHVLVIRNRVRDCLETQQAMETNFPEFSHLYFKCHNQATPHHARYAAKDRRLLDTSLESEFGKGRPIQGRICIATQTVQQSLDLDADILITDICPMDILLQRIGRLHRHEISKRPEGFELPKLIVITPPENDFGGYIHSDGKAIGPAGIGTVYENICILEATRQILNDHPIFNIPDDCRFLVESALHPECLSQLAKKNGTKWERHLQEIQGQYSGMKRQANLNIMNWESEIGDTESLFPSSNLSGKISTRLGEGDRLVQFPDGIHSPFDGQIFEITLSAWTCRDVSFEATTQVILSDPYQTVFSFGDKRFLYDRWGIRPQEWNISALLNRIRH